MISFSKKSASTQFDLSTWKNYLKDVDRNANTITQMLCASAPLSTQNLDDVIAQLSDEEQIKVLRYWQQFRFGSRGESQAAQEMQRAFASGPIWKTKENSHHNSLPPLYPPA